LSGNCTHWQCYWQLYVTFENKTDPNVGAVAPNTLYFTAGVGFVPGVLDNDIYADGLCGSISSIPEPASVILLGLGMIVLCGVCHWGSRRRQRGSTPGRGQVRFRSQNRDVRGARSTADCGRAAPRSPKRTADWKED